MANGVGLTGAEPSYSLWEPHGARQSTIGSSHGSVTESDDVNELMKFRDDVFESMKSAALASPNIRTVENLVKRMRALCEYHALVECGKDECAANLALEEMVAPPGTISGIDLLLSVGTFPISDLKTMVRGMAPPSFIWNHRQCVHTNGCICQTLPPKESQIASSHGEITEGDDVRRGKKPSPGRLRFLAREEEKARARGQTQGKKDVPSQVRPTAKDWPTGKNAYNVKPIDLLMAWAPYERPDMSKVAPVLTDNELEEMGFALLDDMVADVQENSDDKSVAKRKRKRNRKPKMAQVERKTNTARGKVDWKGGKKVTMAALPSTGERGITGVKGKRPEQHRTTLVRPKLGGSRQESWNVGETRAKLGKVTRLARELTYLQALTAGRPPRGSQIKSSHGSITETDDHKKYAVRTRYCVEHDMLVPGRPIRLGGLSAFGASQLGQMYGCGSWGKSRTKMSTVSKRAMIALTLGRVAVVCGRGAAYGSIHGMLERYWTGVIALLCNSVVRLLVLNALVVAPVSEELLKCLIGYVVARPSLWFGLVEFMLKSHDMSAWVVANRLCALISHASLDGLPLAPRIATHASWNVYAVVCGLIDSVSKNLTDETRIKKAVYAKPLMMLGIGRRLPGGSSKGGTAAANRRLNKPTRHRGSNKFGPRMPALPVPDTTPDDEVDSSDDDFDEDDANQYERNARAEKAMADILEARDRAREALTKRRARRSLEKRRRLAEVQLAEDIADEINMANGPQEEVRLYIAEYDIVKLFFRQHFAIVPLACTDEAQTAYRLGYKSWRVTKVNLVALAYIEAKLASLSNADGYLSAARYWGEKYRQEGDDICIVAVQRHIFKNFEAERSGLRKCDLPEGALNCLGPVATRGATSYGVLSSPLTTGCMCLLNSFAGWEQRRDSPSGLVSLLCRCCVRAFSRLSSATAWFLGGPYSSTVVWCFVGMSVVYKTPAAAFYMTKMISKSFLRNSAALAAWLLCESWR